MIGIFPDPLPDELLYSACGRFQERVRYPNKESVNTELFGVRGMSAKISLPSRLEVLLSKLPPNHLYAVDGLIDNHTLLPFYSPFLPIERVTRIRVNMRGTAGSAIYNLAGIHPCNIRPSEWLYFCPLCVEDDRRIYGESYWHRLHQVPGVKVCPVHRVYLEQSQASTRGQFSASYLAAEQFVLSKLPILLDLNNSSDKILFNIAVDAAWLLNQRNLALGNQTLRNIYLRLLRENALATPDGKIWARELLSQFRCYYPSDLLYSIQCDFEGKKSHYWPSRLINCQDAVHPLRHLLLMQFLGYTAESFFNLASSEGSIKLCTKPFGSGPWPCLNSLCKHFGQRKIKECVINHKRRANIPIGVFCCVCGFEYARKGPDTSPEDQYKISWVRNFGEVWMSSLRSMWEDSSLSLREIACRLGTNHAKVKHRAIYLGLKFPRVGPSNKPTMDVPHTRDYLQRRHNEKLARLSSCRKELLCALRAHPNHTRKSLKASLLATYNWLDRHDHSWLMNHLPPPLHCPTIAQPVDWASRDSFLSQEVQHAALRIRTSNEFPVRVTKAAIKRAIGKQHLRLYSKYLVKLPLTERILVEVLESHVDFTLRKVQWAIDYLRQENAIPTREQLIHYAATTWEASYIPKVNAAISEGISYLRSITATAAA